MKIFISHTKNIDFVNDLYRPIRESALNDEHDLFLPHEDGKKINTKEQIQSSDLIISEVSFPATGSGIEIGWADAAGVPLLCVYKEGSDISGSLKYLTDDFIEYSSPEDLVQKLTSFLSK